MLGPGENMWRRNAGVAFDPRSVPDMTKTAHRGLVKDARQRLFYRDLQASCLQPRAPFSRNPGAMHSALPAPTLEAPLEVV
jgi:hypothetical protein